jgi:FkbM family methyltransferase
MSTPITSGDITDDAFLGGQLQLLQPRTGYRAGIDAVFLAASVAVPPASAARVLDVGSGVGTVGLCIAARCPAASVVLLEREPQLAALARENVDRNRFVGRVAVAELTVGAPVAALDAAHLTPNSFDHVVANPPYHDTGRGTRAPDPLKAASHEMVADQLDDWVRFMARVTKAGGTATLVHKADALPAVLAAFTHRFGAVHVLPLHPREGAPASRILVQGIKGSRAPLVLLSGFVLHDEGSAFTPRAKAILRDGAGLTLR